MASKTSRDGTPAGGTERTSAVNRIAEPASIAGLPARSNVDCLTKRPPDAARIEARVNESRIAKPLTVTVATARRISGLGNTTLWGLIKDRRLQAVRIGRRTLITYRSLEALLEPDSGAEPKPSHRSRSPRVDRAPGDR